MRSRNPAGTTHEDRRADGLSTARTGGAPWRAVSPTCCCPAPAPCAGRCSRNRRAASCAGPAGRAPCRSPTLAAAAADTRDVHCRVRCRRWRHHGNSHSTSRPVRRALRRLPLVCAAARRTCGPCAAPSAWTSAPAVRSCTRSSTGLAGASPTGWARAWRDSTWPDDVRASASALVPVPLGAAARAGARLQPERAARRRRSRRRWRLPVWHDLLGARARDRARRRD